MAEVSVEEVPLCLVGETVDAIWIDHMIRLLFSSGATVGLECAFSFGATVDSRTIIDPDGDKAALAPILRLHTVAATKAAASGSTLNIEFADGSYLSAGPDPAFESWHYTGPETPPNRIIITPGGAPAIWLHDQD
ncbi:hypothetical protein HUN59_11485 [Curtobacterium sp. Csp2]|uniref:DUF6188 family protein n=1 Tax=Curtobacterium TaxID=2034 RepID=UPI0015804147|nr:MULTISPECIES: DUF6188 family protein [Curtobacterium]MDK8173689.1 DUF6188 family protein [Curtobacterium citreum]QKS16760.1 hypothetical protein HUN59_11485 [Curtobacterium sp. Csp2]